MGHNVEVFTSGCDLCKETLEILREVKCDNCILTEYNLSEKCETKICLRKAKEYGIKATPTVVIDGKIVFLGKPAREDVKRALEL